MTTQTATVKVVSTDPASQGPFVIINEADFDEAALYDHALPAERIAAHRAIMLAGPSCAAQ